MDQLVVLQGIYESFSKGGDGLQSIDPRSIKGSCPDLTGKLLKGSLQGCVDEDVCLKLLECLQDVFEIKRLGDICRKAGQFGLAIRCYNRALSLCGDASIRPVLHNNLGQAYATQGDTGRASLYFQKAAKGFECAGDSGGQAHVLGNLGSAYRRAGNWDKAIESTYRSLKTFEEMKDDLGTAQMTGSLGRIYAEMGERDLAERYFERSLKDFQRLGDKKSAAWIWERMGNISFERKDWDQALKSYHQSLSLFGELDQRQSAGTVLFSLGRMYLAMDQPAAARESLEKALLLVPKGSRPAYQNALSCLAAAYSALGRDYMREASNCNAEDEKSRALEKQAAQAFARASDRYLELDSVLTGKMPQIKVAAAMALSRSHLAKLSADVSDQEAVALAERAAAALDDAIACSEGPQRSKIEGLKRSLVCMKEARSISLLRSEPWKLTGAVASAAANLRSGLGTDDADNCISGALKSLDSAVGAEKARMEPGDNLSAAASDLRRAKDKFSALGTDLGDRSASKIDRAAGILEELAGKKTAPFGAQSRSSIADHLNYRPQREALLSIAWVSIENLLAELDDSNACYLWDESLNLMDGASEVTEQVTCAIAEPTPETKRPVVRITLERDESLPEIPAKDSREVQEAESSVSSGGMLVPVKSKLARTPGPQIYMHREIPFSRGIEIVPAKQQEQEIKIAPTRPQEPTISAAPARAEMDAVPEEIRDSERENQDTAPADPIISEFFHGPQQSAGARESLISRANGIIMVKAMTLVVVLLLAIDTVLHLI